MTKKEKIIMGAGGSLILIFAVLLGILGYMSVTRNYSLEISLNGEGNTVVEYGQEYTDPGIVARLVSSMPYEDPVLLNVETDGTVDAGTLGEYCLTYRAIFDDRVVQTVTRTVTVQDTTPPEIVLAGETPARVPLGQVYSEAGYTATDNYDGDLTGSVTVTVGENVITYQVADSSGNTAEAAREITFYDDVPPVINLSGARTMLVMKDSGYSEPGYSAWDNLDGDVTGAVKVTGGVDTGTPGTYTVKYSVTDSSGNAATAVRTVQVIALDPNNPVTPNGKVIYLTFDDGPGPKTPQLLDILKKYNVKATFFTVNTGCVATIAREAAEGHTVAVHSATHKFDQIYRNEDAYFADLEQMSGIIQAYTGQTPNILRFPGGTSNTISRRYNTGIMTRLAQQVTARGYRYFDWNVDSNDAGGATNADTVFNNVVSGCANKNVSVVLQHDIKGFSIDAVERIIVWGLSNGYTFLPLSADSPECHHRALN